METASSRGHRVLAGSAMSCPGYVRVVIGGASRGLIVAEPDASSGEDLNHGLELATAPFGPGFRLGIVARGPASRHISAMAASIAARRGSIARVFPSEHEAAGGLMS